MLLMLMSDHLLQSLRHLWTAIALMTCPGLPAGAFFVHSLTKLLDGATNTTLIRNAQGHPMP